MSIKNKSGLLAAASRYRCLLQPGFGIYFAILTAFIGLGVFVIHDAYTRQTQNALASADNLARVFSERLDGTLRRIDGDLKLFVDFLPPDALNEKATARYRQQFENQFRVILEKFPDIVSRNVVNASGNIVYRAGVPVTITNFADRDWFMALRDNPQQELAISNVIIARATGQPTIVIARAIRDRNGQFLGAANAALNLTLLNDLVSSLTIGEHGIIVVRRTDQNTLVLRYPPATDKPGSATHSAIYARIERGETMGRFISVSTIDGIERAVAFHVLERFPFYVTVGLAPADYLADWRRTAMYGVLAAFALMLVMSAFLVSRLRNETRMSALLRQLQSRKTELRSSEQFLRDVIESTSDGILVEDTGGRVRAANGRFLAMWKLEPVSIGNTLRTSFETEMAAQLVNPDTLPLRANIPDNREVARLRPVELIDGRRIETTISLLLHDGHIEGRVWSFHDVTESKRTFRLYRSIIESSADAFIAFDHELRITNWSARAEKMFGISEADAHGNPLASVLPQAGVADSVLHQALAALRANSNQRGRPAQNITARRADGSEFPGEIQISGFLMGAHWQYTSFLRDISLRVQEEEQIAQAQKFEAIAQLTGGLAHDFNNMLGIISGSLDLISEDFNGDRELLEAATSAARRGAEVTQSLLAVARKQRLSPQTVDIDALLAEIAPLLRHTAGREIELEVRAGCGGATVNIDPGGLNNALLNLVINARDAMPNGGRIIISAAEATDIAESGADGAARHLTIKVEDNGSGMPAAVAARAFDPFFTTKPRGKGTGLGLAMVYGFARQSGGSATLSSTAGKGTTIELRLPVCAPARAAANVRTLPANANANANANVLQKQRILLVDDEADLLRVSQHWLESLGYVVVAETSATRAAELLKHEHFAALISDVVMPGNIDGITLADQARQRWPDMAVLLVSGFAEDLQARNPDCYPLLDKPFSKIQLQQTLLAAFANARPDQPERPKQAA